MPGDRKTRGFHTFHLMSTFEFDVKRRDGPFLGKPTTVWAVTCGHTEQRGVGDRMKKYTSLRSSPILFCLLLSYFVPRGPLHAWQALDRNTWNCTIKIFCCKWQIKKSAPSFWSPHCCFHSGLNQSPVMILYRPDFMNQMNSSTIVFNYWSWSHTIK